MRKSLLVIFFLQFLVCVNSQSIIVNGSDATESDYEAEQLLTEVLLDGGLCSSVANFQLKENPSEPFPSSDRSWGYFESGTSDFPFEKGIVLTSGFAVNAQGPDGGTVSDGESDWTGDVDAAVLAGYNTNNATVFEFDFVPQGDEISFNYIFASEEYPDWACSSFNDVFGFILSGPGITNDPGLSGKNIALLPNGLPVTINNVNDQNCGDDTYYVAGPFASIQHGGRTTPLTAYSEVVPGETYHIRLLIADAGDTSYDSAVFLEAGTFNLGAGLVDENGVELGDNYVVQGDEEFTIFVDVDDPDVTFQWYKDGEILPGETSNSIVITESGFYEVEITSGECSGMVGVNIEFCDLEVNGTAFTLEETDINADGSELFDLTEVEPEIVDNPDDFMFTYYLSLEDAENETDPISDPTAYTGAQGDIIYVIVEEEATGCTALVEITLELVDDCINPEPVCADDEYGSNIPFLNDGEIPEVAPEGPNYDCLYSQPYPRFFYFQIETPGDLNFFLNQYTEENQGGEGIDVDFIVWGPFEEAPCNYEELQQVVDCSFSADYEEYVSIPNTQAGEIYLLMITNYAGSYGMFGYVNLILDENTSTASFDCSIVTGDEEYSDCDDDLDGQVEFDLNSIAEDLADGDDDLTIAFYDNEDDATNDTGTPLVSPFVVTEDTNPSVIYAQIKDNGSIVQVITVTLTILEGVTGAENSDFFICDLGNDGVEVIDLTEIEVIQNPELYTITYYEEEQDAIEGNASFIPNPSSYEASLGIIYVRIQNENGCFTVVEINIDVAQLEVDLGEDFSMCEGEFTLTANGDFSSYTDVTFVWARNNTEVQSGPSNTLLITSPGQYTVTVETAEGCTGTDTLNVLQGETPVITEVTVGLDYVIVEATGGVLPYEYSLTGVVWQESNQFNYLQPGIHTIYVKSAEGCITTQQFAIFRIATMFTPNGDGINDTWNIPGLEIYPGSSIVIYDRNGRLIYEAELNSEVIWDGYFKNGQKAPTQDYWYIINVSDGRKFTGHVTVKSRGEKN